MPPTVVVTGRDDRVTSRHKAHTQEKIAKLERYFDGIVKIEAILDHVPEGGEAEIVISVSGGNHLVCHAKGKDLYAAVDLVLDKAEKRLTRHKEKLKGRGKGDRRPTAEGKAEGGAGGPDEEDYQDIVNKRKFS